MTYKELLNDPRWKAKAYEVKLRDKFTCRGCKRKGKILHVHHGYYIKGKLPWEYRTNCLYTLCETCHKIEHYNIKHQMVYESEQAHRKATRRPVKKKRDIWKSQK
jgi:5-methylcytosine-specific restriction endonuclease McrA